MKLLKKSLGNTKQQDPYQVRFNIFQGCKFLNFKVSFVKFIFILELPVTQQGPSLDEIVLDVDSTIFNEFLKN